MKTNTKKLKYPVIMAFSRNKPLFFGLWPGLPTAVCSYPSKEGITHQNQDELVLSVKERIISQLVREHSEYAVRRNGPTTEFFLDDGRQLYFKSNYEEVESCTKVIRLSLEPGKYPLSVPSLSTSSWYFFVLFEEKKAELLKLLPLACGEQKIIFSRSGYSLVL